MIELLGPQPAARRGGKAEQLAIEHPEICRHLHDRENLSLRLDVAVKARFRILAEPCGVKVGELSGEGERSLFVERDCPPRADLRCTRARERPPPFEHAAVQRTRETEAVALLPQVEPHFLARSVAA